MFNLRNTSISLTDLEIDLHGFQLKDAFREVNSRLNSIEDDLNLGLITPLLGDGRNHVVKIICGKGTHSKNKAVLKYAIPGHLKKKCIDHYNLESEGVVYVRLIKKNEDYTYNDY